jgi:arsenate reductase
MQFKRHVLAAGIAVLALAGLAAAIDRSSDAAREPTREHTSIVFVCLNGVSMSVWSARTFDRLAAERGLPFRAIARASAATYTRVPLRMQLALWLDGYRVGGYEPHVVSAEDVRSAERVILIETELPPAAFAPSAAIETWTGFPPMREKYFESRTALQTRVQELVERLAASRGDSDS